MPSVGMSAISSKKDVETEITVTDLFPVPFLLLIPYCCVNLNNVVCCALGEDRSGLALCVLDIFLHKGDFEHLFLLLFPFSRSRLASNDADV